LSNPPLLEHIAGAPVLANTKLIAEAWDAAGLYQVGTFPHWGRWSEWNGKYRDDIRGFVKGDQGMVSLLATRLSGSADLYQGSDRAPYHSINFITSHDGFTLADLVSYNEKHNEDNGENGRDGANDNLSWNCGEEGQPCSPEIAALRCRQMKNFTALLLLSQGTPMILSGDEMGRTQRGNNNAYCQDNDISWNDWVLLEQNRNLFRFYKLLIRFRKNHAVLRRRSFDVQEGDRPSAVSWHGFRCGQPDWSDESRSLGMLLRGIGGGSDIFVVANADWQAHRFEIPQARDGQRWCRFIDTALDAPRDICEEGEEFQLE
ncbi:MAG: glycogen debranching enzyme, partial [Deltaproteobacteria bacterium]|nr:glycogen debranching enzyme [Deltaproteobacteria bacterium]